RQHQDGDLRLDDCAGRVTPTPSTRLENPPLNIPGVPDAIPRKAYVGIIESLGLDAKSLVDLEFGRDVIRATVYAKDADGKHIIDRNREAYVTHDIAIPVVDDDHQPAPV